MRVNDSFWSGKTCEGPAFLGDLNIASFHSRIYIKGMALDVPRDSNRPRVSTVVVNADMGVPLKVFDIDTCWNSQKIVWDNWYLHSDVLHKNISVTIGGRSRFSYTA